jgi:O-antigen/teichoic acid export membrane protein
VPPIFGYDAELTTLIHLAIFIMIADTLSLSLYGVLRGLQNLRYESLGIFVGQSITTILGITFVFLGIATLPMLMVALIVGSTWNVVFSGIQILRRLGWSALKTSFELGFTPLKAAFAFFLAAIFSKLYAYADSLILHEVLGTGAVGLYAVANKFTYAFQFLPLAFVAALYPTMSSQAHNPQELKRILLQGLWYMALMAFPIVGGIFALAPEIIGTFMSADYLGSILPLQILIFVLIFLFLDYPLGSL